MYLFLDIETTGLPLDWKAPVGKLDNWPRIVEIAWILTDKNANELEAQTVILKPDGFTIPKEASALHGISDEKANKQGTDRVLILKQFAAVLDKAQFLVAHNIDFDKKVVHAEFIRYNIKSNIHKIDKLCTKELTTDYCKIPGSYGYKWPTLGELYEKLFSTALPSFHSALGDVKACKNCFFELLNRGIIKLYGSKALLNTLIDTDETDLIQVDEIEDEISYSGDLQYFTRVRHLGLKEQKFLKAHEEALLGKKIERQIERFEGKWEKAKIALQNDYYKQSNILEAEEKTKEAEEQLGQLGTLLEHTIDVNDAVKWQQLKNHKPFKEVSPANYLQSRIDRIIKPTPTPEIQIPREPQESDAIFQPKFNFFENYLFTFWKQKKIDRFKREFLKARQNWGAERIRIESQSLANRSRYEKELDEYHKQIEEIEKQNQEELHIWEQKRDKYYQDQKEFNAKIDQMKADYFQRKPQSIIENCDLVLGHSRYPEYFPKTYELDYDSKTENLIVDYCLPSIESLPRIKSFKYVKAEDNLKATPISETRLKAIYSNVVFQVAVRTVHELYEADTVNGIKNISFNG